MTTAVVFKQSVTGSGIGFEVVFGAEWRIFLNLPNGTLGILNYLQEIIQKNNKFKVQNRLHFFLLCVILTPSLDK